jgi:LPS-assembly protein
MVSGIGGNIVWHEHSFVSGGRLMTRPRDNSRLLPRHRKNGGVHVVAGGDFSSAADASVRLPVVSPRPRPARFHTGLFSQVRATLLAGSCLAVLAAGTVMIAPVSATAQVSGEQLFSGAPTNANAQMLLEADELIYDEANNSVAAVGNVQIAYDGYTLVAERVTYDRGTGRVIASGGVEIVEPKGNRVFAQEIDVTDNFQDGFVSALRVETPDNTRFIAESAERRNGDIAVFNNGVYTACEPCRENPSKPPLWQIRANRIIINNATKTVSYEGASFELFGKPIAYLPKFSHADPSIKRKSGFLFVRPTSSDSLGYSAGLSYFWALAPNYDLTATGRYYTNQGFLGQAEWRHRTHQGEYNIKVAGIDQQGRKDFSVGEIDRNETERGAVMSTGKFKINEAWQYGWNFLAQSDGNFARTYNLEGYNNREITNEAYLTGLDGKSYFDLRAQKFLIQDDQQDQLLSTLHPGKNDLRQEQQAKVLPSFDYNAVSDEPVAGGQVSVDINVASLKRDKVDVVNFTDPDTTLLTPSVAPNERYHGLTGQYTRATVQGEWKASTIVNGAMVTASLSGRGDAMWLDTDNLNTEFNPLTSNNDIVRGMPAAMLEIRYPLIATDGMTSQIFEPIAQIIARPNETQIGKFPNEDAQSMVFDTTNLFERDKFSGFDRVEGGTRANVGFRYALSFNNGASINVAAGQSFHLHGKNSFAERDLVNAGLESGLETDKSDYVASVDLNTGTGLTIGTSGRFDEKTAEIRRGEVSLRYNDTNLALASSYIFIDAQPIYSFTEDRHEINTSASVRLNDRFRLFGNATYDIQNSELYSRGIGLAYDDSCTSLSVAYSETDDRYTGDSISRAITFRLGLRTLTDTEYKHNLYDVNDQ